MRRFLAGALALVMAFSTPGMSVMAQDSVNIEVLEQLESEEVRDGAYTSGSFTYELSGSSATITDYTGSDTNLVIPEYIDGYKVTGIGASAFYQAGITSLVISEGVVNIDNFAFNKCTSLTSITIPSTLSKMGEGVFGGCTKLTNITVNNNSYFKVVNGALLSADGTRFLQYPCGNGATSYTIPATVTKIDWYAFQNSSKLASVVLPAGITNIYPYTFSGCSSLSSIVIPEGVKIIEEYAFEGCMGLTTVTLPASIQEIYGYAFRNCYFILDVYYSGTEADWAKAYINDDTIEFATIHYASIGVPSLSATVSNGSVVLNWSAVENATAYKIYRASSVDGAKTLLGTVTNTTYTDSSVSDGNTYYYFAIASGSSGDSVYSGPVKVTISGGSSAVAVTGVTLNKSSVTLTSKGATSQLTAAVTPDNATNKNVTWTSSNSSVATVSSTGLVTAVASGSATITVKTADGAYTDTCAVTVSISSTVSVTGVSLDKTSLTMTKTGEIQQLVATVKPDGANNKNVTWTSSNESVAVVDSEGYVTAVANGTTTITATTADGGYTARCQVNVEIEETIAVTGIYVDKSKVTLTSKGATQQLTATVFPGNATNQAVTWKSSNTSVATVSSDGLITAVGNGTATITATTVEGGYSKTCAVTVNIPVSVTGVTLNKTSLTFTSIWANERLTATVSPDDATDKTITWTSSNTSIAQVSSDGLVTAVSAGTATITATAADGVHKATCTVTVDLAVAVTGVTLNKETVSLTSYGATETLVATVAPTNATNQAVTWKSSNTSVATVSSNGVVTAKGNGTTTITVTTSDGSKTDTCKVTVAIAVTGVSLNATSATLTGKGATKQLTATVSPSNAANQNVTWTSSNTSVATVSSTGVVTAVAEGTSKITVKTADGSYTATCTITVDIPATTVSVTGVSLNSTSATLTSKGATKQLTATVTPTNATDKSVSFISSNTSVATVSSTGLVTAVANGTTTITVKTADGNKTATCKITVNIPVSVTGVSLSATSATLTSVGATKQLTATVTPSNATNQSVTWSTSDGNVAAVSAAGLVTARGNGTATITAKTADGSYTATCKITVAVAVTGVAITPTSVTLTTKGATKQLVITTTPVNAANQNVTWKSSNTSVATVSSSGLVTAVSNGTATITATTEDGGKTASIKVTVNMPISVTGVSLNTTSATLTSVGATKQLTATVTPSNATNQSVAWSTSDSSVAVVSAAGLVTAKGNGTATITAKTADGSYTATCKVTVAVAVTSVTLNATSTTLQSVGATYQLKATIMPVAAINQAVTWKSSNESVATVSNSGLVTAKGNGTATITVTTVDGGYTDTFKVTVSISSSVVSVTGVSLNATSATLSGKGATKQLTATVAPSNATNQAVTWTSSNKSVATVSSSGLVTAVANGTTIITVTTADGSKTATCRITVNISSETISVTGISLDATNATLTSAGATKQLTATVAPANATNQSVTWSTSDSSVAVVSSSGLVTVKGNGTATITAKTADGSYTATCKVTVAIAVTGVSITPTSVKLTTKGETKQLTTTITPLNAANQNVKWTSSNKSVATVSDSGLVTAISSGTTTVTATTVDGNKTASIKVTVDIPVSVTGVSLDVTNTTLTAIGATKQLTATVAPANATNQSVTWSTSDSSVAVVSAAGLVTARGNGTATITAKTADGSYTATCKVTVAVAVASITLNATSTTLTSSGATYQIKATIMPTTAVNQNVTWTSSNTSVATVSSGGLVTAVSSGTTTITATTVDGGKTATCKVTVSIPVSVTGVSLNEETLKFTSKGATETLTATVTPSNAVNKSVTWTSSNTSVATVDSNGKVTSVGNGTATITVETADGGYTDTCTVTVDISTGEEVVNISWISIDTYWTSLSSLGETVKITVTINPDNATNKNVTWTSSDTSVATVDKNGLVTAVGNGTTTITVTTEDGNKQASCTVVVNASTGSPVSVTGVSLSEESLSFTSKGATETLTATIAPSNATNKNVTWTSSDTSVATVDENGKVTSVGNGTATITVTTADGKKTAICKVTVEIKVTGVSLDKSSLTFTNKSETAQLTATVTPANAKNKNVTWTSSNTSVAKVDSTGKVMPVGNGNSTITVTTVDGNYTAECDVTVSLDVAVTGVTLDKSKVTLSSLSDTAQLTATIAPSNATNKNLTWTSSNTSVAKVDSTGKVTPVGNGKSTITVTTEDGNYTAECIVTVEIPSGEIVNVSWITIDKYWASLSSLGETVKITVTINPSNATNQNVTWTSSDTSVATVDKNGLVTAVGNGTTTITVTTEDGNRQAECTVVVNIPTSSVSVTGIALDKNSIMLTSAEATEQLTATISPGNATNKNVTWTSSDTSVATVNNNGLVTAIANGTTTITVKTADGGYTATCEVKVEIPSSNPDADPLEDFVERMYTIALGRSSDAAGKANWVYMLNAGTHDGAGLAAEFILGEEFKMRGLSDEAYVDVLYKTFFNRDADTEGKALWLTILSSGQTRGYVLSNFVNLPEFTMLCASYGIERGVMLSDGTPVNPGIPQFVKRMYTIVLGRDAENEGLYNNVLALVVGAETAESVAKNFFTSQEYILKGKDSAAYVTDLYAVFMNREADADGLSFWVSCIEQYGMTRDEVLSQFAASAEFKAIAAGYGL